MNGHREPEPLDDDAGDRWVLVFVAQPGDVRAGRRVAQVLKYAKRTQGLRCIEASSFTPDEQLQRLRAEVIELRQQLSKRPTRRAAAPSEVLA